jgi:hypothetical protein
MSRFVFGFLKEIGQLNFAHAGLAELLGDAAADLLERQGQFSNAFKDSGSVRGHILASQRGALTESGLGLWGK